MMSTGLLPTGRLLPIKSSADIFISIHVNAARRKRAHGVEAFFLSFDATDDEARETAAFENNVISLEGKTKSAPMDDIKSILWDLTQTQGLIMNPQGLPRLYI